MTILPAPPTGPSTSRNARTRCARPATPCWSSCGGEDGEFADDDRRRGVLQAREELVRQGVLAGEPSIDGRDLKTVRPINVEVGIAAEDPRLGAVPARRNPGHRRATLGALRDAKLVETLEGTFKDHFMLHYNFPPYSVGEEGIPGQSQAARDRPRQRLGAARRHARCLPSTRRTSPTRFAWCRRSPRATAQAPWRASAAVLHGPHGRRRAHASARWPASPWAWSRKATASPC